MNAWIRDHGSAVLRLAYAFLMDRHQAEDVFQEAFLKAHRHAGKLRETSKVRSWLLSVTANQCRDLQRSAWWRRVVRWGGKGQASAGEDEDLISELADPRTRTDPAVAAETADTQRMVARAVWRLPAGYRETVVLYYLEGLDAASVAQLTGVREGTVHSRLHRARQIMRTELENWGVEP